MLAMEKQMLLRFLRPLASRAKRIYALVPLAEVGVNGRRAQQKTGTDEVGAIQGACEAWEKLGLAHHLAQEAEVLCCLGVLLEVQVGPL